MTRALALAGAIAFGTASQAQEVRLATPDDALRQVIETSARSLDLPQDATRSDTVAAAHGDYSRVIAGLYANGFFGPTVSITLAGREASELSTLQPPEHVMPVVISVDQGPLFTFGRARIGPLAEGTVLPESFATGKIARTEHVRDAAAGSVDAWRKASHAKADIATTDIVARHPQTQLDVDIRIDPGPALRFGRLVLPDNTEVRARRLQIIAGFPTGAPYHPDDLRRARERLVNTGTFNTVVLREADAPNPDGTLDVALRVEDAAPRRLGFGAEISSDEGLSIEAFWLHRNIFGGAERLRLSVDIDGIAAGNSSDGVDYELGGVLTVPGFRRPDDTLTVGAKLQRLDEPTYRSDIFELGVLRARDFDEKRSAAIGVGIRTARTRDAFGEREFRHVLFTGQGTYDGRDDKLAPRRGQYFGFEIRPFVGVSGSESGARLTGDVRAYAPVGEKTVLAGRLQLGSVVGASLDGTPPEFLFLYGGGGSVRGRDFQELGVELPAGRVGGRSFVGVSAEVRRTLRGNFGVVGFVDYGYVAEGTAFADGHDHAGFGLGARYKTGLGSIRIDLATQAGSDAGRNLFLYVGLGDAF